jgi:predicted dehydrogenase
MAEAEEIRAALKDYRGTAQMTFQNRFFPATMRAKQWIEAGGLGDVLQFRVAYLHSGNVDPQAPARWKLTAAGGGGVIADIASHVLDLIEHLAGPLRSLTADTHIAYPQRGAVDNPAQRVTIDAEDCVVLLARLAGGAPGTIEATKLATGSEDELRVEIHGTRGALRLNGMDPHHLEVHDATAPNQPLGGLRGWTRIDTGQRYGPPASGFPALKSPIGWVRGHAACLANFLAAVAEGRPAEPGLQQGLRVQYLMHCIRESAARRAWVDVG